MVTVTLYTLSGCVDCQAAGQAMDRKDISFGLIDVGPCPPPRLSSAVWVTRASPVTVIRNVDGTVHDHWHGLRPENLRNLVLHRAQLS